MTELQQIELVLVVSVTILILLIRSLCKGASSPELLPTQLEEKKP
jgi:hypothetical protein